MHSKTSISSKCIAVSILFSGMLVLQGCAGCTTSIDQGSDREGKTTIEHASRDITPHNDPEELQKPDKAIKSALSEIDETQHTEPTKANIGEWANATDNLAVTVVSVEEGPYDYADATPTMKVTVAMKNLTDHTLTVKASNWNADNTDGQRVDHKLWIKDADGNTADRTFEVTRISPNATFTGVVYFDGDGLADVVYEPHWLLSPENQYIYWIP